MIDINLINLVNTRKWKKDFLGIDITPTPPPRNCVVLEESFSEILVSEVSNLEIFENSPFLNFLKVNYTYGFFDVKEVKL